MLRMRVFLENSNMGGVTVLEGGEPACMAWSAGGYNTRRLSHVLLIKWWSLFAEGLLSTRPTPSSLYCMIYIEIPLPPGPGGPWCQAHIVSNSPVSYLTIKDSLQHSVYWQPEWPVDVKWRYMKKIFVFVYPFKFEVFIQHIFKAFFKPKIEFLWSARSQSYFIVPFCLAKV